MAREQDHYAPRLFCVRRGLEDETPATRPGRGRGLAIVRESVLVQHGEITVGNRPGGGAEFRIGLEVDPGQDQAEAPAVRYSRTTNSVSSSTEVSRAGLSSVIMPCWSRFTRSQNSRTWA